MIRAVAAAALFLSAAGCSSCPRTPGEADGSSAAAAVDAGPPVSAGVQLIRDADTALQAGDLDKAISLSTRALELEPRHPLAPNILGRAAARRFETSHDAKDAALAERGFRKAYEVNPDFWPALQNLGELAEKQGKTQEAAEYYARVLKAQPDHPEKERFEKLIRSSRNKQPRTPRRPRSGDTRP